MALDRKPDWEERYKRLRALVGNIGAQHTIPTLRLIGYLGAHETLHHDARKEIMRAIYPSLVQLGVIRFTRAQALDGAQWRGDVLVVADHEALDALDTEVASDGS